MAGGRKEVKMEKELIKNLADCLDSNEPVALVSLISSNGSSPRKSGAMMIVKQTGEIFGSVGGGSLEKTCIQEALAAIGAGESREVKCRLTGDGGLAMTCGGEVHFFIKVFLPEAELLIVGGGHIGQELYTLGLHQGFRIHIFDNRPELVNSERFPGVQLSVTSDMAGALRKQNPGKGSFIAIATSSHDTDRLCLEAVVNSEADYIGMIGSSSKIQGILKALLAQGVSPSALEKLFVPMGLNIATRLPREIAMSIMSEILLVKNRGSAEHMREVKKVNLNVL